MTDAPRAYSPDAVHLLRTTQAIHVQFSAMADAKANILMSATSIIFTLSLGQLSLGRAPAMAEPLLIMAGTALLSAVLAILTVMPSSGGKSPGRRNLLFFGSFARLPQEEFSSHLLASLRGDEDIYKLMIQDIYQNGRLLARKKYRLLGYAYGVLLAGLAASFVAYLSALL